MAKAKKKAKASPDKHLPHKAPRKTGKRGIGPRELPGDLVAQDAARQRKNDPEPPEQHEQEAPEAAAEELETPSTPKRKPRQARLPGVDDPEIEELESAAEEYVDVRDRRMALTEEEVELKGELLKLMHEHNKTKYVHNGTEIRVVAKDETVKVKIKKKDE